MDGNDKIVHVALEILPDDLLDFYKHILGVEVTGERVLEKETTKIIFGIEQTVKIYFVRGDGFELELFVSKSLSPFSFSHICLVSENADKVYKKALGKDYHAIKWGSDEFPTYFIKDGKGNLFELKN